MKKLTALAATAGVVHLGGIYDGTIGRVPADVISRGICLCRNVKRKIRTAVEGVCTDIVNRCWQINVFQRGHTAERLFSDRLQRGGNLQFRHCGKSEERRVADADGTAEGNALHTLATIEGIRADVGQRGGESDAFQCLATGEGTGLYLR